ncbi:hypothetical protein RBSH_00770 [Rhodopirellula baltica SH28]|uniref:Uncharacterized protein n=1 Tax=Rhodopirellula baltica SH28 TaxID=993517 RepID=K5DMB5_RHOBT|nr:hypothetical protein RBSH_00770 [Rhodopirellula baltica SH28]
MNTDDSWRNQCADREGNRFYVPWCIHTWLCLATNLSILIVRSVLQGTFNHLPLSAQFKPPDHKVR